MNEQNNPTMTPTPVVLPAKRKRGRPRKDGIVIRKGQGSLRPSSTPISDGIGGVEQIETKSNDRSMVGRVVSGVIDGCFDAGYFLSVRIGNNVPPLRGVIFEPGKIMPISSENDVAPQAKLYQRTELPMPAPKQQNQGNGIVPQWDMQQPIVCSQTLPSKPQSSASYVYHKEPTSSTLPAVNLPRNNTSSSTVEKIVIQQNPNFDYQNECQSIPGAENLRMVEQDEIMQVYEVSVQSETLTADAGSLKDWKLESSIKPGANIALPHKEIMDQVPRYQNQDMGFWPEPTAPVNDSHKFSGTENLVCIEPQSVPQETLTVDSEVKQNQLACNELKHPCHDFSQSSMISQFQAFPGEPSVIHSGFQPRESVHSESEIRNFELHETPIVAQTPSVPLENQNLEAQLRRTELIDSEIHGSVPQAHFLHRDHPAVESKTMPSDPIDNQPTRTNNEMQSVFNSESREAEVEPRKLAQFDLENQNFGILRDLVAGNHHYLPPEVISDQPGIFTVQK
nr:uncharacterized protein LOC113726196 [Coffea arabica]